jgi:aspartyl-tRNA(Asn)/glutamyl-tRNA(Gln) amidotransferase subunit A
MINASLKQLSAALAARQISSVELTQLFQQRIDHFNPQLNAFITLDSDRSLAEARAADARLAAGTAGPLTGIPIGQKDIFCTKGWRTTCGSRMLHNFISPYDAHLVEQSQRAGLVSLGKLNMDEFAMGSSNETSFYGKVHNPWDLAAVPGGSSGGSAAAVAARLVPAASATDTGGSIRQPASHCGITGLKPTYGVISRYGMIAFASSLDQAGPMAKSAEDCALLLNAFAGFDPRDSTSVERPAEDYTRNLNTPLQGLKIGLPKEFFAEGLSADVAKALDAAIAEYKKLGAEFVEVSLSTLPLGLPAYYVIAPAEASSNLSRFDGVRYGHRASEYRDLNDMYEKTRAEGFGDEVKRRILVGTYVLSHGYYDAYYIKAQQIRRLIADDFQQALKQCDVLLGPVTPTPAFNLGEKSADPLEMYLSDVYGVSVNLAGLPGMSVPAGFASNGRPIGLQLIGNYFDEARLLHVAHQYQQVTDWHLQQPALTNAR